MAGSLLFALGSVPSYSQLVDGRVVGITFVIGSLCFTGSGYSAVVHVINDGAGGYPRTKLRVRSLRVRCGGRRSILVQRPRRPGWWSSILNYLGSMFFMASAIASFTLAI